MGHQGGIVFDYTMADGVERHESDEESQVTASKSLSFQVRLRNKTIISCLVE